MMWINLAKKIISIDYPNKILSFLALGVLISNLKVCQNKSIYLTANSSYQFTFANYLALRSLQTWEMN